MNRLNQAYRYVTGNGYSRNSRRKRLQLIEQNLGKQAAYNAALEMLGDKIGPDQAEELRKFGETFKRLGNSYTVLHKSTGSNSKTTKSSLGR